MRNILYLGFLGFNNLGDEVCYQAFLQNAARTNPNRKYHVIPYDLRSKPSIAQIKRDVSVDDVVIGGGSLLQGTAFINPAMEAVSLKLPLWIYGTGIDYMDEGYAKSVAQGHFPLMPAAFENKDIDRGALKTIFETSRYNGVRGPLSLHFLKRHCMIEKKIHIIGDPGLVYHPTPDRSILDQIRGLLQPVSRIIAINWGSSYNSIFGHNEHHVRQQVAQMARNRINSGYQIVIFPMWDNDQEACRQLYDDINMPGRCILVPRVPSIDSICALLKKARLSVNFKLHANILSALVNTPFVSLAYRSKCFDFALSMNQYYHCISTAEPDISEKIGHLANKIAAKQRKIKKNMKRSRRLYTERHDQFFERFWKM